MHPSRSRMIIHCRRVRIALLRRNPRDLLRILRQITLCVSDELFLYTDTWSSLAEMAPVLMWFSSYLVPEVYFEVTVKGTEYFSNLIMWNWLFGRIESCQMSLKQILWYPWNWQSIKGFHTKAKKKRKANKRLTRLPPPPPYQLISFVLFAPMLLRMFSCT